METAFANKQQPQTAGFSRWWIYQRERFPLFAHGPLVLAFSSSAVCFSRSLRGAPGFPPWRELLVAFCTCLLFFLGLRIADEFKDFDEDSRYRPYRPVPRGLVTLRQLGFVGAGAALAQLILALWLQPKLTAILLAGWLYLGLMSKEFFAREWLKARPVTYLWTHMLIMPIVDFYATACDWMSEGGSPLRGLTWFLAASFFNGVVIEFGRKIRAAEDEEVGVQTYSAIWGRKMAVTVWLAVMMATAICATQAARNIHFAWPMAVAAATLLVLAVCAGVSFLQVARQGAGKRFELISGLWTLVLYLTLGLIPLSLRVFGWWQK